jgi:hypothetical protein
MPASTKASPKAFTNLRANSSTSTLLGYSQTCGVTMDVEFQRHPQPQGESRDAAPPATWDYALRPRRKPPWTSDLALCTCPKGHTFRLSGDVHSVAADGKVHPSYVCPAAGCGFHEWVRLVGWDPGHVFEYMYDED